METFLIKAAQLIAAFALLVIIHEFGHYIFARMFGIKVEKFYLFFDPWFSLFKYKPKKKTTKTDPNGEERATWRDTEYGIGWLPLGGYVKIAGMIDESMDKEQLAQEPKSWEFRSKPAYQRLLVMVAGVLMNFILAIIIYAGIAWYWGEKYIPLDKAYEGMDYAEAAQEIGFRNGDIPLFADGEKLEVAKGNYLLEMAEAKTVTVLRNHKDTVDIAIPENFILRLNDEERFLTYRLPVYIGDIVNG
ncbi:site-2 protease family protein, partial [uncultured Muribaculum sp.]